MLDTKKLQEENFICESETHRLYFIKITKDGLKN
jgi:hypothetical protein